MSERKTININPELLSFTSTSGTRKKKPKTPGEPKQKSASGKKREDSLKKRSILKMIRQRQEDMYKSLFDKSSTKIKEIEDTPLNKEFKEAELFFQNLTEKKEEEKKKNATIKRHTSQPQSLIFHPSIPNIVTDENINIDLPLELMSSVAIKPKFAPNLPKYGCLKNGTLPTYRTFMNKTVKQNMPLQSPNEQMRNMVTNQLGGAQPQESIMNDKINDSLKRMSEIKQTEMKLKQLNNIKAPTIKKQRKIRTRTYKVGKSKVLPKVSVLVSNKTLRNKVSTQSQLLKQVPIQDVKKYLMKRGLIKIGSIAPQDVLRKMYESSIMICGEVQNHNPDNLLYNFIYGGET